MSKFGRTANLLALCAVAAVAASTGIARGDSTVIEEKEVKITSPPAPAAETVKMANLAGLRRSNYDKRLDDMLDQINMGFERGWLTSDQSSTLKSWQSDCKTEVSVLKDAGGGVVPSESVNLLERHVNSLAWMINRQIGEGSRKMMPAR